MKVLLYVKQMSLITILLMMFLSSIVMYPQDTKASYEGSITGLLVHADDCDCNVVGLGSWYYIPGSVHKVTLKFYIDDFFNEIKASDIMGLEFKWKNDDNAALVKSDGLSAWYTLKGKAGVDKILLPAEFSYTGYTWNGKTYSEVMQGNAPSGVYDLQDEFWLASPSCNPDITIEQGSSQQLKIYAQHFTTSDPYGKTLEDVTSWIDWSKVHMVNWDNKTGFSDVVNSAGRLSVPITAEPGAYRLMLGNCGANAPEGKLFQVLGVYLTVNVTEKSKNEDNNQDGNSGSNNDNSNSAGGNTGDSSSGSEAGINGSEDSSKPKNTYDIGAVFKHMDKNFYFVTDYSRKTVTYKQCGNKKASKVVIPNTININGMSFKVTAILKNRRQMSI